MAQCIKNLPVIQEMQETWVWSLWWEDPLEEGMATHFNILARLIPWIAVGSQRVRHDRNEWALHTYNISVAFEIKFFFCYCCCTYEVSDCLIFVPLLSILFCIRNWCDSFIFLDILYLLQNLNKYFFYPYFIFFILSQL